MSATQASLTIRIPSSQKARLEAIARARDLSVSQLARRAIRDKLQQEQEQPAKS